MKAANVLWVSIFVFGCGGGGGKPASTTKASAKAEGRMMTQAQLKLGHFTTADGMHGFVLDRTGATAKIQVDGSSDIIELTMEEDRVHGDLRGYKFVGPDNKKRIYITTGGSLIYFKDGDDFWASHDKDVKPLGKATIAGAPVKEVSVSDKRAAAFEGITVRKKMSAFTANDSANLAKVAEAFEKADASMFVRYKDPGKDGWQARMVVTPSNISGMSYGAQDFVTDEDQAKRHAKLAKHGAMLYGYSSPESAQGNHIIVREGDKAKADLKLEDGTPGLIWEIDGSQAVFVSIDGGRYNVDITQEKLPLENGAGPASGWPKPATDTFADMSMISAIAKAGGGGDATMAELEKIDGEWNACVVKAWKPAMAKLENVERLRLTEGKVKAEIKKVHTGCLKHLDAFESVMVKWIDERTKARLAIHAKAAAKAKTAQ